MKKIIIFIGLLLVMLKVFSADTLYLVSGEVYHFDERIEEYKKRPVLFLYNESTKGLDSLLLLSPQEPFTNLEFIGLYNTFDYLVVLKRSFGNASQTLSIVDLNTLHKDSVVFKDGVTSESNLFVKSDSVYYSVEIMGTKKIIGFDRQAKPHDFFPEDYNYAYIQGGAGTPIYGRDYLILYNEKSNDNALHISKGGGYGLKVGPYLKLQPTKDIYNAHPPALKSVRVNDFHSMIISYDESEPRGDKIGEKYFLIYDKVNQVWYNQTLKGNTPSIRSYDNGWVGGTVKDMDKGKYFDKTTMRYGTEYDFKREIPGYEEREQIFYERTDGIWGDCFDERAQNFGTYYPGLLYLFNVHTKDYIEWDTKQGDSEVLLVQDGYVYYRVNTKILKSVIVDNKQLSEPELLVDDVRVRDIHWAYLKKENNK
jgi:hypothetical protein